MLDAAVLAMALESRAPRVPIARAEYLAGAIARVAEDEHEGAVLLTTGDRESWWSRAVERCAIEGIGGWGTFGVAGFWGRRFPGGPCGSIDAQARASRAVWWIGAGYPGGARSPLRAAFGRYIGARRYISHPEIGQRVARYYSYRGMIECRCSTSFFIETD